MTREQLIASLETEKDPIGAIIAYIQKEESGYIRHDLDAKNNGWDPFEYPENGYIWHEAESILLEAAKVEDLDDLEGIYDDTYATLVDAIGTLLEGDEDEAISKLVEAWNTTVDEGETTETEMAMGLMDQLGQATQGWSAGMEIDMEAHPEIAELVGLTEDMDDEEWDEAWERWEAVEQEAARRWLAFHPEACKAARAKMD